MKNRNVGFLIIGISIVIGLIIIIFNVGLKNIVDDSCTHGLTCTMYDTILIQTWLSGVIAVMIFIIGLFFVFSKEPERVVVRTITKKVPIKEFKKVIDYSKLDKDEKVVMKVIEEEEGSLFQATLVDKTEFSKVKVTRILDRLEGRGYIERKRRGMSNIVILK